MSHFTVLVPAKDEKDLEAKLLPYHEYECTGIEAYLEFVPADLDDLQRDYEKHGDGRPMEEFAADWGGYTKNEAGIYGRTTNPNAKWDWWQVGGRWTGLLRLKPGAAGGNGTPGLMTEPNRDEAAADYALAQDIDWEAMRQHQIDTAVNRYRVYHEVKAEYADKDVSAEMEEDQETYSADDERGEQIRKRFATVEDFTRDRLMNRDDRLWKVGANPFSWDEYDKINLPESEYQQLNHTKALTFAFIDLEGKWNERGNMGWFAIVSNPNPDYDKMFWAFLETIPGDIRVYVVDCHI